ncbi:uncharacterized protein CXQ87_003927 [Candidozyma duobushaemuli]|uniref:AAA+ ATPase domain-containing protein n=1 Tax=Candidozyma duobushaemuli TaxID=1231522 RepID=A0A2V1AET8_9ASCO|nr:uncharacterized protein CXQ87_003927 [[Candida] duobushaemulonis]PVH16064.1 hypothetical protein CXQ87_003927 [[Candida] duobushaemulonis]
MFSRRKPPQLSVLEELQQTYNDVCNSSVKNLHLEETGHLADALKGWKSLHTSLLYKVDIFEKSSKIGMDEQTILSELKAIRDENVKHLVRIQLRLDEENRRRKRSTEPVVQSSHGSSNHKMTIPSLRNSNPSSRSLNSNNQRQMMKSLRPQPASYKLSQKNRDTVQAAVAKSWSKPAKPQPAKSEEVMFDDFDQTEYAGNGNWERLNSHDSASTSNGSFNSNTSNLIDLEDENGDELHFFDDGLSKSVNDLTLKKSPPPPPPPRARQVSVKPPPVPTESPPRPSASLDKPAITHNSKSTSDVPVAAPPKKYVYQQPARIDVKKMMAASSSKAKQAQAKTAAAKSATTKPLQKTRSAPPQKTAAKVARPGQKSSNITYKYVPATKPGTKPAAAAATKARPQAAKAATDDLPMSPTMDDILGGYDDDDEFANGGETDGMNPSEQEALIKSIRGIDEVAANQILNDIVVRGDEVYWDDIVGSGGLSIFASRLVPWPSRTYKRYASIWPPGTGKTMLARAVATESKSTFFSISSSSLTSKYLGESEKLVKALFLLARKLSPSIVFIDEIDSLLGTRTEGEVESMRRIKNEFLVQWSELSSAAAGRDSSAGDVSRVLILGATNLPWGIDDAARRRFAKRVYIPLPEDETRKLQIFKLLQYQKHTLSDEDFEKLVDLTKSFSGSDITLLAKDSAMGPLRSLGDKLLSTPTEEIRPIQLSDFVESLKYIRPSVSSEGLGEYEKWAAQFGSSGA